MPARQWLIHVLLGALVLNQLALLPHAHGAGERCPAHDKNIPHVHVAWLGGHEHSHDCEEAHSSPGTEVDANTLASHAPQECDVIYLPLSADEQLHAGGNKHTEVTALADVGAAQLIGWDGSPALGPRLERWRPPDKLLDDSHLYLRLRTLRI